jgi:hypothetical protein
MDPDVVRAVLAEEPACLIDSVHTWYGGRYRSTSDAGLIALAAQEGLTLVTRDLSTIPQFLDDLFGAGHQAATALIEKRQVSQYLQGWLGDADSGG